MVFSKEFIKIVENIHDSRLKGDISDFLTHLIEGEDFGTDFNIDYIDCDSEKNDMITFITEKKLKKLFEKEDKEDITYKAYVKKVNKMAWTDKSRTKIKIGRFINKLIDILDANFNDTDIEDFVNCFKGFNDLNRNVSKFEIVSGENIRKYYLYDTYQRVEGHLGESCMRYKRCQEFLDIYVENPEICQLLILKADNEKIFGRALIWKTTEGVNYLDRVYSTRESDIILFNEYAKTKLNCNHTYSSMFSFEGEYVELSISPLKYTFKKYPYMDTFRYFYDECGVFHASPVDKNRYKNCHVLDIVNGLIE